MSAGNLGVAGGALPRLLAPGGTARMAVIAALTPTLPAARSVPEPHLHLRQAAYLARGLEEGAALPQQLWRRPRRCAARCLLGHRCLPYVGALTSRSPCAHVLLPLAPFARAADQRRGGGAGGAGGAPAHDVWGQRGALCVPRPRPQGGLPPQTAARAAHQRLLRQGP